MEKIKCRISDEGASIILLKVLPGKESRVLESLRLKGNRYLGLGHYDILLIKEGKEFEPLTEYIKDPDVVDWGSLHVFKYDNPKNERQSLGLRRTLGVCCIKFDYRELKNIGISKELELVSNLYSAFSSQDSLHVVIGGGIGFYDVLVFIESDEFGSLANALATICRASEESGVVKDIVTIPCLNYDDLMKEAQPNTFRERLSNVMKDKVNVHFIVDCIPGPEKDVYALLNDCFKSTPMSIFGEHDFILKLGKVEAGEFLSSVLLFREKAMNMIVSTQTIFEWDFSERPRIEPSRQPNVEPHFSQLATKLSEIRNKTRNVLVRDLSSEFWRTVGLMKRAQMNLTTNGLYQQICDLLFEIYHSIVEMEDKPDGYDKYLNISETLTEITYSLSQRYSGVQGPYLFSELNSGVEEYGGINRLVLALEALPKVSLERFGFNWKGFCIFGYAPEPRRFEFGIINMPRAVLFAPEEWHGAFHESGHEVFNLWLNSLSAENRQKLEKEMYREDLDRTHQLKFLWEVFSDAFSFVHGFLEDWELYEGSFWEFLLRERKGSTNLDLDHLSRTFALFYILKLVEDERSHLSLQGAVDKFVSGFCATLKLDEREKYDWPMIKAKLIANIELSEKGIRAIIRVFSDHAKTQKPEKDGIEQLVSKGIVPTNVDPACVLYHLMKIRQTRECTFKERMTCIMSLLDYTLREHPVEKNRTVSGSLGPTTQMRKSEG